MINRADDELALLGRPPTFDQALHVGRPNLGNRGALLEKFDQILDRRWLTNDGLCLRELEQRLAERLGVKHCLTTCNGTQALEFAARACELEGEVIVPSFTFVATAHAFLWQGIRPVFCDIDPATHNLDPEQVESLITPRTSAIVGVHLWGRPCNVRAAEEIAERHGLTLLFDAAHAFASSYQGRMIGNFGRAEAFSFHATKFFHTFEGGAVATNDDHIADQVRLMRNFGFTGYDQVDALGVNGKLNEFGAAMGLTLLDSLDELISINRRNYRAYREQFAGLPGVQLQQFDETQQSNFQYMVLEVDPDQAHLTRDELIRVLHAENVFARRYFHPGCHRMEPYKSLEPNAGQRLPVTERVSDRVLAVPNGSAVSEAAIVQIGRIVRTALERSREVRTQLEKAVLA